MRKIPDYLKETSDIKGFLWIRKCPNCKEDVHHRNFHSAKTCHKQKRMCYNCGCWNKGLTKETNSSIKKMSEKVSNSMKILRETIPPWNVGLTKENNTIIQNNANKHRGYRHTDISKNKIGNKSKELWNDLSYRNDVIKKLKKIMGDSTHILEWRLKMEQQGYFTPLELKSDFEKYKSSVKSYTKKNNLQLLKNYNNRGRSKYHLDHKYSITQGFLNDIPPEIIGSIHNLEMLNHKNNITKNSKCSISKKELLEKYYGTSKNQI